MSYRQSCLKKLVHDPKIFDSSIQSINASSNFIKPVAINSKMVSVQPVCTKNRPGTSFKYKSFESITDLSERCEIERNCPAGNSCPNLSLVRKLKSKISSLMKESSNQHVMNSIVLKNYKSSLDKYKGMFKQNQSLSKTLKKKNSIIAGMSQDFSFEMEPSKATIIDFPSKPSSANQTINESSHIKNLQPNNSLLHSTNKPTKIVNSASSPDIQTIKEEKEFEPSRHSSVLCMNDYINAKVNLNLNDSELKDSPKDRPRLVFKNHCGDQPFNSNPGIKRSSSKSLISRTIKQGLSCFNLKEKLAGDYYKSSNNVKIPSSSKLSSNRSPLRISSEKRMTSSMLQFSPVKRDKNRAKRQFTSFSRDLSKPENHYYKVRDIYERHSVKKYRSTKNESLLSLDDEGLIKLLNNQLMKELFKYCLSDYTFIEHISSCDDNQLIAYCDLIAKLIVDYRTCINLISRIKTLLRLSISITSSLDFDDAIKRILKNCCEVLQCDRGTIFIYDSFTDMLIVHHGDKIQNADIKIEKSSGIAGHSFVNNEKLNISEPYNDDRFNRDVDKKLKFITHSILCCPLRRKDNTVIGVIEVINKKGRDTFNKDDEELIEIFSLQISSFIQHSFTFDDKLSFVYRLKQINEFRIDLSKDLHIATYQKLFFALSNLLMAIWGVYNFQMFFCISSDLYLVNKSIVKKQTKVLGLVSQCIKVMKPILCDSIYDNVFYNNIIDLDTYQPIITIPVYNTHHFKEVATSSSELLLLFQSSFYSKRVSSMTDLSESDDYIVTEISSIISSFMIASKSKIYESLMKEVEELT